MKLSAFPLYCGGRLLTGLYNMDTSSYPVLAQKAHRQAMFDNILFDAMWNQQGAVSNLPGSHFVDPYQVTKGHKNRPWVNTRHAYSHAIGSFNCFPYIPPTLIDFQIALAVISNMYYYASASVGIGTIIAVTNQSQDKAATFLESTGFKQVGFTNKVPYAVPNCKTWVGDWCADVYPILSKVKFDVGAAVEVVQKPSRFQI